MSDPWRFACPEGHRAIRGAGISMSSPHPSGSVYCHSCEETYPSREIVDLKTHG